jgi:hypothetical protein
MKFTSVFGAEVVTEAPKAHFHVKERETDS